MYIDFNEYFYYDETSPSCLRWKVDIMGGKGKLIFAAKVGGVAGSFDRYWRVKLAGKRYQVHRVIAKMRGDQTDGLLVDHKDGNAANNKGDNIRVCTNTMNMQNKAMSSRNTTGVAGVSWVTHPSGTYAVCSYRENSHNKSKTFSVKKFGLLPAFAKAVEYRAIQISRLNNLGAAYTERHGKPT